jgi:starvation-inducible DNA-binding protein
MNIGIESAAREQIVQTLHHLLSDETVLHQQTKTAHWNVSGVHFSAAHALFEEQAGEIINAIDEIAERIRMLNHHVEGSFVKLLPLTQLSAPDSKDQSFTVWASALLQQHEMIIRTLRAIIGHLSNTFQDHGTADFLTGVLRMHEKMAWMLRVTAQ